MSMNAFMYGLTRAVAETFPLPAPILEIGSYQVEGEDTPYNLRPFFSGRSYVGLDVRPGPGVDTVGSVEKLPFPDGSVGTVLALNTFEHVPHFWRGFEEIRRVLRPDGALVVSCPFYFRIHNHPSDYWRFTPEAIKLLLADYPAKVIGWHGPRVKPASVWAIAFREGRPAISENEYQQYRHRMRQYARMPLPWARWLSYRIGVMLCGRSPFAPYLDREHWETECLNDRVA
jgi:SAM-dependent methyltransferase